MTHKAVPRKIDAHHHLWVRSRTPQPWIDPGTMGAIDADFTPDDLDRALAGQGVTGTVVVQSVPVETETTDLLDLAARTPVVRGVVGWVDLADPGVADAVARLRSGPGGAHLVGVRSMVQAEQDPGYLDRADLRRGLRTVAGEGLAVDLVTRHEQLPAVASLVREVPEVSFVLDHLGKPPLAGDDPTTAGDLADWAAAIDAIAAAPNVTAKLSGLVTEASWDHWSTEGLRPAVARAVEAFGPGRLMFGSDWPVSLLATRYDRWVDTLTDLLAGLSPTEQDAIWHGTARRAYGLPAPTIEEEQG
ncbi:amidohydrolase family protein [Promicromonospora sp. MEB111]|uniref:amidohydrolase family protein n=1 Tax=Promicromonospora sp. MEB111 TaxID=3040301 RepID=UPI00254EA782|nr:amidohydrolase family protein [Promicromonospora sp. MEB111]